MTASLQRTAILLATLNGEDWIGEQLLSIIAQQYQDWHVFLRDDGSSDRTVAIAAAMMPASRLTILDPTGGATGSPAGNFFAALGQVALDEFDYVCFCDQDDIWAPDKLARAIACLASSGAAGYSCDLIAFDNEKRTAWYIEKSQTLARWDYLFQGASAGCTYVLTREAGELVKKKTLPLMGAFPKARSHDWLTYAICRSHSLNWFMDRSAHIFYRQHSSNAFGGMPGVGGLLARLRLARAGWYREHVMWLRQFLAGTPGEMAVLDAVERGDWRSRLTLVRQCSQFRRRASDARKLALLLALGLL